MAINRWRCARYLDDGVSEFQCLSCYQSWASTSGPGYTDLEGRYVAGWRYCPYCAVVWEREEVPPPDPTERLSYSRLHSRIDKHLIHGEIALIPRLEGWNIRRSTEESSYHLQPQEPLTSQVKLRWLRAVIDYWAERAREDGRLYKQVVITARLLHRTGRYDAGCRAHTTDTTLLTRTVTIDLPQLSYDLLDEDD